MLQGREAPPGAGGVYSSAKGVAYLLVALLVQEGTLDLDRAVAHYWPEFAAEGKAGITLRAGTLAEFSMLHSTGTDLVRGPAHYAPGFEAKGMRYPFLSANAFGHDGTAGSEAFADPRSGVTYGYTRRRCAPGWGAPENDRLAAAVLRAATADG